MTFDDYLTFYFKSLDFGLYFQLDVRYSISGQSFRITFNDISEAVTSYNRYVKYIFRGSVSLMAIVEPKDDVLSTYKLYIPIYEHKTYETR